MGAPAWWRRELQRGVFRNRDIPAWVRRTIGATPRAIAHSSARVFFQRTGTGLETPLVPTVLRGNAVCDALRRLGHGKTRTQSVQDGIPTQSVGTSDERVSSFVTGHCFFSQFHFSGWVGVALTPPSEKDIAESGRSFLWTGTRRVLTLTLSSPLPSNERPNCCPVESFIDE
jgi:hypothetical protein